MILRGLQDAEHFSAVIVGRGEFDNDIVEQEILSAAESAVSEGDVGAFLLECSDMPPYAHLISAKFGLPVFDFTTLIKWLYTGVCRKPFYGWI